MNRKLVLLSMAAALALTGLSACDNGPSAVRARDHSAGAALDSRSDDRTSSSERYGAAAGDTGQGYARNTRTNTGDGENAWAASRKHPAAESAAYHFQRDGADFGAQNVDQFVAKAHAFIARPPHGTLKLERSNGDVLLYDPKANVFAVATRDGLPRTMFKPRDGMAYWAKQKDTLNDSSLRGGSGGGSGGGSSDQSG